MMFAGRPVPYPLSRRPARRSGALRRCGLKSQDPETSKRERDGPHREGEEPKPMMHGREKSDLAIVAVKPANKAKEAHCGGICGGGRSGVGGAKGGAKGNTHRQSTRLASSSSIVGIATIPQCPRSPRNQPRNTRINIAASRRSVFARLRSRDTATLAEWMTCCNRCAIDVAGRAPVRFDRCGRSCRGKSRSKSTGALRRAHGIARRERFKKPREGLGQGRQCAGTTWPGALIQSPRRRGRAHYQARSGRAPWRS